MSGVKPSLKAVRPIGCRAVVKKTDAEMRSSDVGSAKFAARGHEGVYLGTERNGPAYMVWVPSIGRVKFSACALVSAASCLCESVPTHPVCP